MKKLLLLFLSLLLVLVVSGCGGTKNTVGEKKILRVATDANFPPFEYYQKNSNAFTGFDIELMHAIGREAGYDKVEFTPVPFRELLQGLQNKKYDAVIAGMTITPERSKLVAFTDDYLLETYKIVVAKGVTSSGDWNGLDGKRIAVENASVTMEAIKDNKKLAALVIVNDIEDGFKKLHTGEVDAVLTSKLVADFYIANGYKNIIQYAGSEELMPSRIGIAVHKDNIALVELLNKGLKETQRSGEFKTIYTSYFGNPEDNK